MPTFYALVPSFYGIQHLKKKKAAPLQRDVGSNITEGNDCLTASHRALITDVAGNVFMLAEYRRTFGINFKYIEKIPSITNHRFLLSVHGGYYPHPLLVPWSRKGRAIPLLSLWAVGPVQSLSARTRLHFTWGYYNIFRSKGTIFR